MRRSGGAAVEDLRVPPADDDVQASGGGRLDPRDERERAADQRRAGEARRELRPHADRARVGQNLPVDGLELSRRADARLQPEDAARVRPCVRDRLAVSLQEDRGARGRRDERAAEDGRLAEADGARRAQREPVGRDVDRGLSGRPAAEARSGGDRRVAAGSRVGVLDRRAVALGSVAEGPVVGDAVAGRGEGDGERDGPGGRRGLERHVRRTGVCRLRPDREGDDTDQRDPTHGMLTFGEHAHVPSLSLRRRR